jgi:hypothetical protein
MYVCMYACMYVCVYVCMHVCGRLRRTIITDWKLTHPNSLHLFLSSHPSRRRPSGTSWWCRPKRYCPTRTRCTSRTRVDVGCMVGFDDCSWVRRAGCFQSTSSSPGEKEGQFEHSTINMSILSPVQWSWSRLGTFCPVNRCVDCPLTRKERDNLNIPRWICQLLSPVQWSWSRVCVHFILF